MGEFAWNATYSIGNAQIDAEHQGLIELANDIATFADKGEQIARIRQDVFALYDHIDSIFSTKKHTCSSLATRSMRNTKNSTKKSSPR